MEFLKTYTYAILSITQFFTIIYLVYLHKKHEELKYNTLFDFCIMKCDIFQKKYLHNEVTTDDFIEFVFRYAPINKQGFSYAFIFLKEANITPDILDDFCSRHNLTKDVAIFYRNNVWSK